MVLRRHQYHRFPRQRAPSFLQRAPVSFNDETYPVSYPKSRPPVATKKPTMMAGADEPATLSGLRQPMAMTMITVGASSRRTRLYGRPYRHVMDVVSPRPSIECAVARSRCRRGLSKSVVVESGVQTAGPALGVGNKSGE
jgi:hypothetical protein